MAPGFLAASDLELMKSLSLRTGRRLGGFSVGEQRSPAVGGGIEFADYREYLAGDDVRGIDWSVYLRSEKLMVKLRAEEKELTLMVLLDLSRSMASGEPEKLSRAKRIAAILAGIAASGGNRAGVASLGDGLSLPVAPERGRVALASVTRRIALLSPTEAFDPVRSLKDFASRFGHRCIAVLVSDLLYPDWKRALQGLSASGCDAFVVHLLSPDELDPSALGESTLVDRETGEEVPIMADRPTMERYRQRLEAWLAEVKASAAALGLRYCLSPSNQDLNELFCRDLRGAGLLC